MADLPTGTVTFVLTDIEDSSRLWEEHPDVMGLVIQRHHQIVHGSIDSNGGKRPADQGEGDSVLAAFSRATDAVACAVDLQLRLMREPWPAGIAIKVRIAIHSGEAELRDPRNYAAPPINRAARIRSLAHGGQILISQSSWDLVRERPPKDVSFRDLGSHALRGLAIPEQVFQVVHPDLPGDFLPLRGVDQVRTNFPAQLSTLVGREQEIRDVEKLVMQNRLVTITGAAGCGKTRLALEVGTDLMEQFPDGVWFVDLAPVNDPHLVADTAAIAMGFKLPSPSEERSDTGESGSTDAVRKIVEHVRSRHILMVLDNCEHLITASALLADRLLRECVNLRVVATSREPLGLSGEAAYRVPSLRFPSPGAKTHVEEIAGFEAVRLFVDRAALAHSNFQLTPENAVATAQIVARLDGIPLAIELAAARIKTLTPDQIAARLDDQFRLLTGGQRTALERQQTIRAAVDWSHQLLSVSERALLRRLSVFAGGFTLEAAEQVCSDEELNAYEILDLLGELVAKSLVVREDSGPASRFRLLETIRQFGREKLVETQEASIFRARHRDHFLAMAEASRLGIQSRHAGDWLNRLETDLDNVRAAIEWSLSEEEGAEIAQRLASSLEAFWYLRGRSIEGYRWVEQALSKSEDVSSSVKAETLSVLARLAIEAGMDLSSARRHAEEAAILAERVGSPRAAARAKLALASAAMFDGDHQVAESLFQEAMIKAEGSDDPAMTGQSLVGLIQLAFFQGRLDRARELSKEATRHARAGGFPIGIVRTLSLAATFEEEAGEFRAARSHLEEALAGARATGDRIGEVRSLGRLTRLLEADGQVEEARSAWSLAVDLAREKGDGSWLFTLSQYALRRHDYKEARALAEESLEIARELRMSLPLSVTLNMAGWVCYCMGDIEAALRLLEEGEGVSRATGRFTLASLLHSLGETRRVAGQEAAGLLSEALEISREIGSVRHIWAPLWSLGEIARTSGEPRKASVLHREALAVGRMVGADGLIQSLESIAGLLVTSNPRRSAEVFAAAVELRGSFLEPRTAVLQAAYEVDLDAARQALGERDFDHAWSVGKGLTLDDAVSLALAELGSIP